MFQLFECRVFEFRYSDCIVTLILFIICLQYFIESVPALNSPMIHSVHLDMEVSPNSLVMIGSYNTSENSVFEGKNVTVTCVATGNKLDQFILIQVLV